MAWDVVIVVTIIKVNDYTRVETEDMEHVGDMAVQTNVCNLVTMENIPMELIGWRINYMNQGFMPSFQQNKITGYMN